MVECYVIERKTKDGKPFTCLEVKMAGGYTKTVFLDRAEQMLVKMSLAHDSK